MGSGARGGGPLCVCLRRLESSLLLEEQMLALSVSRTATGASHTRDLRNRSAGIHLRAVFSWASVQQEAQNWS